MKLEPDHKLFVGMITASVMIIVLVLLTGCTLTVDPSGTRTWAISGEEVVKGIIVATELK